MTAKGDDLRDVARGDVKLPPATEPTTEAGRRLLGRMDVRRSQTGAEAILAIEAEARADFWRDFDRYAFSHPEVPGAALRASVERLEATLRADALREAAERVRALHRPGRSDINYRKALAILDPEAAP